MDKPLGPQFRQILRTPSIVVPGVLDAVSAWYATRNWLQLAVPFALVILCSLPFLFSTLRWVQRKDVLAARFLEIADDRISFSELYEAELQSVLDQVSSKRGWKSSGFPKLEDEQGRLPESPELIEGFRVCVQHAQGLAPTNTAAVFRRALIEDLRGNMEEADGFLALLAPRDRVISPKAHAIQILRLMRLDSVDPTEFAHHLEVLRSWEELDPRIALAVSYYLESTKDLRGAIEFGRLASKEISSQHFRIAQIATLLGDKEEVAKSAEIVIRGFEAKNVEVIDPRELFEVAWLYRQVGRVQEGIKLLQSQKVTLESPPLKRLLSDMILDSYSKGASQANVSVERLNEAARVDPDNPRVGELAASILQSGGTVPLEARSALRRQLDSNTANAATLAFVSKVYFAKEKFADAILYSEKGLVIEPGNVDVLDVYVKSQLRMANPNLELALSKVQKGLEEQGRLPAILELYGDILLQQEKTQAATQIWEEAIEKDRSSLEIRRKLVRAYQSVGKLLDAKKHEQI